MKCRYWWSKNCVDPETGEYREEAGKSNFFNKYGDSKDGKKKTESKPPTRPSPKSDPVVTKSETKPLPNKKDS